MKPYISFIATSRNDNHGLHLLERMQLFIDNILTFSFLYKLPCELILIEWNPPKKNPRLKEVLNWSRKNLYCKIRIIEVPSKIHEKFKNSRKLPLYQMTAKNVGIRRAKGNFLLLTNVDIVFSQNLFKFLSQKKLQERILYRIDRTDIGGEIPYFSSPREILNYCQTHQIRMNKKNGTITLPQKINLRQRVGLSIRFFNYEILGRNPVLVHTNACGDFMLMDKKSWFKLRGYAELEVFSWKLDGLFCYCAHYAGIKEFILKNSPIFHLEHSPGSGYTPEHQKLLEQKLKKKKLPVMTSPQHWQYVKQMRVAKKPIIFNDIFWGLAKYNFKETIIQ